MSSWLEELNTPVVALTPVGGAAVAPRDREAALAAYFRGGLLCDRAQANELLNFLERLASPSAGLQIFRSALAGMLARRDWVRISISAESAESLRRCGPVLGIAERKLVIAKRRLSPLQKEQKAFGLGRRKW